MIRRDETLAGRTNPPRADTLVLRFAGGMGLTAAAIFFMGLAGVISLPAARVDLGRTAAYAIPGTPRMIDAAVVPVLACCGGVAAVLGLVCLALGRMPARRIGEVYAPPRRSAHSRRSARRPFVVLVCGAAVLGAVLLLKS